MTDQVTRLAAALSGRYAIEKELGAGGMATVYLAQDLRHDRKVALKVLRPELAAVIGAERFLQEIRTTANLQHPHILPLFDSGEAQSFLYYVMPFVEGETLRDRLQREKQLGVEDTIELLRSVASALDYAHRHGVIHRDIKPENILLHDGQALVADFGISLAVSQAGAGTRMTETGLSLGTPHYMSPEQATGDRALDARSDIYSLGCVAYEMLTGDPPHTGSTVQAIVAKVLSEDPAPVTRTRTLVPVHVEHAIRCALSKTPADRFAHAADFSAALANSAYRLPGTAATGGAATGPARLWNPLSIAATMLAGLLLVVTLWSLLGRRTPPPALSQQRIVLWKPGPQPYTVHTSAISPDGTTIVFPDTVGGDKLWIKTRAMRAPVPIPGTEGALNAFFSPDGRFLGFITNGRQVKTIPLAGGAAASIADNASLNYLGGAWLEGGTILFIHFDNRLRRVAATGGVTSPVARIRAPVGTVDVQPLPRGRAALLSVCTPGCGQSWVYVADLAVDSARVLMEGATNGWYLPSGHVLFTRTDGTALAAPFDLERLELTGPALPVLEGIRIAFGQADLTLSTASGSVLYSTGAAAGGAREPWEPVWVTRDGREASVDSTWQLSPGANGGMSISPDGTQLAINIQREGTSDIYIKELDRGPLSRLTLEGERNFRPMWTPDGRSVTYLSNRGDDPSYDLYQQRADGSDEPVRLVNLEERITEGFWSADGTRMILRLGGVGGVVGNRDVVAIRPGTDSAPTPLISDPRFDSKVVSQSPDGRWLAYESTESGEEEVYVRPFPNVSEAKVLVSTNGGFSPVWAHQRKELYFLDRTSQLVAVPYSVEGGRFRAGAPSLLFATGGRYYRSANTRTYDVDPADQRFLFLRRIEVRGGIESDDLVLIENWYRDLTAKLAARP